ncbi:MAG: DUF4440 domain-containing protein [Longimicrobiales bacterium]
MLYRIKPGMLVFVPFALLACGEPPADDADMEAAPEAAEVMAAADHEAIDAVAEYWETHYNMQHPAMVASTYVDSAWVAPADGRMAEGLPAVEAWLTESTQAAPTIDITPGETLIAGDVAVGMGTYAITVSPEGAEPMSYSGSYMNLMGRVGDDWKIAGTMSNYDAPPPDDWQWGPSFEGEMPADDPRFPELIDAYEAAFNAGDAAAVAAHYTDDAMVALSNGPMLNGQGAVQEAMAARMMEGATIEIHEIGNLDLGDGMYGGGGWYQITGPDGMVAQSGYWMNVVEVQSDGSPKIAWSLTNARPGAL